MLSTESWLIFAIRNRISLPSRHSLLRPEPHLALCFFRSEGFQLDSIQSAGTPMSNSFTLDNPIILLILTVINSAKLEN